MKLFQVILFFVLVILCQNICFAMHRSKSKMEQKNPSNADFAATIGVTCQSHIKVSFCL